MGWSEHAICYHVYPLGFLGAPIRDVPPDAAPEAGPGRRLRDLVPWLDYIIELGANALLLGPIFASSSHGYDTVDFLRLDPRLGDDEDFDILVRECHDRGLRVVLDGVFNHVGSHYPDYQAALTGGPDSAQARLFRIDFDAPGGPAPAVFEGHGDLVELDHDSPAVVDLVVEVMNHWTRRGVDGWRLDAAYAVDPVFWARVLPRVREQRDDLFVYGEVIQGDYVDLVDRSGWDSLTQYELWKAIWSSLKDPNLYELEHALKRHQEFVEHFVPTTFIGNHDVTRIASQVGPELAVLAATVLLTVPGVPCIYYGDELAMTGVKEERFGGDDAVRPALPETPAGLDGSGAAMLRHYQHLVGLRRRHPWLHRATVEVEDLTNESIRYVVREPDGPGVVTVSLDASAAQGPSARVSAGDEVLFEYAGVTQ